MNARNSRRMGDVKQLYQHLSKSKYKFNTNAMNNASVAHYVAMESCHWKWMHNTVTPISIQLNRIQSFEMPNLKRKLPNEEAINW